MKINKIIGSELGLEISRNEYFKCQNDLKLQFSKENLYGYSTTSNALDIQKLLEEVSEGINVFLLGISYGGIILDRFMQINNDKIPISGVIFDVKIIIIKGSILY
jgi:hypothetical protein